MATFPIDLSVETTSCHGDRLPPVPFLENLRSQTLKLFSLIVHRTASVSAQHSDNTSGSRRRGHPVGYPNPTANLPPSGVKARPLIPKDRAPTGEVLGR